MPLNNTWDWTDAKEGLHGVSFQTHSDSSWLITLMLLKGSRSDLATINYNSQSTAMFIPSTVLLIMIHWKASNVVISAAEHHFSVTSCPFKCLSTYCCCVCSVSKGLEVQMVTKQFPACHLLTTALWNNVKSSLCTGGGGGGGGANCHIHVKISGRHPSSQNGKCDRQHLNPTHTKVLFKNARFYSNPWNKSRVGNVIRHFWKRPSVSRWPANQECLEAANTLSTRERRKGQTEETPGLAYVRTRIFSKLVKGDIIHKSLGLPE